MRCWWIVCGVVLMGVSPGVRAQGEDPSVEDAQPAVMETDTDAKAPAPKAPPITLSLRADTGYAFRADLRDSDASVSRFSAGGGFDLGWQASEKLRMSFGVDYAHLDYDFNNASSFIPGLGDDPFDGFNSVSFGLSGTYAFDKQWFMTVGGFANGGWEGGASVSDAWSGGGYVTVGMNVKEGLAVGVGVGGSSQLESEAIVFPAIFVRWQISDQFRLESDRLGLRFTYTPLDQLDVYLRANWERREYRLADDHPRIDEGILRDTTVPVGVGLTWRPIQGLSVGVEAGAMVYSKLKFRNDLGNTVFDSELDPGAYVRATVEYRF